MGVSSTVGAGAASAMLVRTVRMRVLYSGFRSLCVVGVLKGVGRRAVLMSQSRRGNNSEVLFVLALRLERMHPLQLHDHNRLWGYTSGFKARVVVSIYKISARTLLNTYKADNLQRFKYFDYKPPNDP